MRSVIVSEFHAALLEGDVAEAVAELKRQPGKDLQVIGSGELVQTLIRHDLVDEFRLMIHPLVLGGGRRLFRDGTARTPLRLIETRTTGTGVVVLTYRSAGSSPMTRAHLAYRTDTSAAGTSIAYETFRALLAEDRRAEAIETFLRGTGMPAASVRPVRLAQAFSWAAGRGSRG